MCLQFLQLRLLESPSSLLVRALPTVGSGNSAGNVNSKTTGIKNRISDTIFGRTSLSKIDFFYICLLIGHFYLLYKVDNQGPSEYSC